MKKKNLLNLFPVSVKCSVSVKGPFLRVFLQILFFLGLSIVTGNKSFASSTCRGEAPLQLNINSLLSLLQKNQAYQNRRGLALTHISRTFFDIDKVTPAVYENRVRCLYTFFERDPETVSELLFFLQKEWESRYLWKRHLKDRERDQTFQLALLGGASLGTSMVLLRNASFAPTYFKFFRKMFFIQGAVLIGSTIYGTYFLEKPEYEETQKMQEGSPPLSPAHLLELPSLSWKESEYAMELEKQWSSTLDMVLGMEAGSISYYVMRGSKAFQVANRNFFKPHLLILLISLAVGVGVDELSAWLVDEFKEGSLEEDYELARQALLKAHKNKEELGQKIPLAETFVEATHALSVFYQWKFLEHYNSYKEYKDSLGMSKSAERGNAHSVENKQAQASGDLSDAEVGVRAGAEGEGESEGESEGEVEWDWDKDHEEALIHSMEFLQEAERTLRRVAGQSYLLLYANILGSEVNRQKLLLEYLNTLPLE